MHRFWSWWSCFKACLRKLCAQFVSAAGGGSSVAMLKQEEATKLLRKKNLIAIHCIIHKLEDSIKCIVESFSHISIFKLKRFAAELNE